MWKGIGCVVVNRVNLLVSSAKEKGMPSSFLLGQKETSTYVQYVDATLQIPEGFALGQAPGLFEESGDTG